MGLEYADAITETNRDVDDELFARVERRYDDDTIAEMAMIIAWENASSRFNRAFRIPSQARAASSDSFGFVRSYPGLTVARGRR